MVTQIEDLGDGDGDGGHRLGGFARRSQSLLRRIAIPVGCCVILQFLRKLDRYEYADTSWNEVAHLYPSDKDAQVCHTDPCLWNAGINGSWVQDFDFARNHGQYVTPWVVPDGPYGKRTGNAHVASEDAPFPWRTSWKWMDHQCSVDVMTYDNICHALRKLEIRHILFFGDSLTESHYTSFVNKMGLTNFDKARGVLSCQMQGVTDQYTIRIFYERDQGGNDFPTSHRGVYRMENGTKTFIQEANTDRMIGVFNIGAHYHNWTHYMEDMDAMIRMLEGTNRTQDLLFFRSTSPGHDNCLPRNRDFDWKKGTRISPLRNFAEYHIKSGHRHDWDKFEGYNNYTKHLLLKRNRMGLQPVINYLDIYNMTVLRSDAHTAPADCLHFQSPGPVDWWNHLLYTYLKMMADHDEADCRIDY